MGLQKCILLEQPVASKGWGSKRNQPQVQICFYLVELTPRLGGAGPQSLQHFEEKLLTHIEGGVVWYPIKEILNTYHILSTPYPMPLRFNKPYFKYLA